jgi:predicted nucleotidyltransferase
MAAPAVTPCASRSEVLERLRQHYPDLASQFKVSNLALFGSFARDEPTATSDVDLLVSFAEPIGFGFMHLGDRLEDLLGRRVDLVASDGIKENRRPSILSGVIHVAP